MRLLAKDYGISVDNGDFQKYREAHSNIDFTLDRMQFDALKQGGLVLESRFSALYHPYKKIPGLEIFREKIGIKDDEVLPPGSVLSIFLVCDDDERYRRLAKRSQKSYIVVRRAEEARHKADVGLYKKIYNLDPFDLGYSQRCIEATNNTAEVNAGSIIGHYNVFTKKI